MQDSPPVSSFGPQLQLSRVERLKATAPTTNYKGMRMSDEVVEVTVIIGTANHPRTGSPLPYNWNEKWKATASLLKVVPHKSHSITIIKLLFTPHHPLWLSCRRRVVVVLFWFTCLSSAPPPRPFHPPDLKASTNEWDWRQSDERWQRLCMRDSIHCWRPSLPGWNYMVRRVRLFYLSAHVCLN